MGSAALSPDSILRNLSGLRAAPHWFVGFSGGVDSTVLLHLLQGCREADASLPPLTAVHVDHGLQAQSTDWSAHCRTTCERWSVPLVERRVDTAAFGSGEAGARDARYSVFEALLGQGDVLFLAHHLDDQVETFFLRLMRGAGVQGLAAMPAQRALGAGRLSRPLLDIPRDGIERYAREQRLDFVDDPSNADTGFDRNYLRAEVLPLLAARWPGYRQAVARATGHMADTAGLLREVLGVPPEVPGALGDPGLPVADLFSAGEEAAALATRNWLAGRGLQSPDSAALREFLQQVRQSPADARPRLELSGCVLERYRGAIYLVPRLPVELAAADLAPGDTLKLAGVGSLRLEQVETDGFVLAPVELPRVRWREGGERLRLAGRGHSTSLKQLLQEHGVPPWWRDAVPLLCVSDEVLCVGDLARCESSRWRSEAAPGETLWRLHWERPPGAPGRVS